MSLGVDATHSEMCRISDNKDPNYRDFVIPFIRNLIFVPSISAVPAISSAALQNDHNATNTGAGTSGINEHESLRDLCVTDPRDDKQDILDRTHDLLKDSCLWICDDPAFTKWQSNDESQILWIRGDPGKGKTMIMMALADEISAQVKTQPESAVLSYFFCQNTNGNCNTATSILRGLIFLLVTQQRRLLCHVQKKFDEAGKRLVEGPLTFNSLWAVLSDVVNDSSL